MAEQKICFQRKIFCLWIENSINWLVIIVWIFNKRGKGHTQPRCTNCSRRVDNHSSNPVEMNNRSCYNAFNNDIFNPTNLQQKANPINFEIYKGHSPINSLSHSLIWPDKYLVLNLANGTPEQWRATSSSHYSLLEDEAVPWGNLQVHSRASASYQIQKNDF